MWRYLFKRSIISIFTIIGIIIVVFFIVRILPGDPALVRAGPYASEKKIKEIRAKYGLNDPLLDQFKDYFVILPSKPLWDIKKFNNESNSSIGKFCEFGFSYNSGTNKDMLSVNNLKRLIKNY